MNLLWEAAQRQSARVKLQLGQARLCYNLFRCATKIDLQQLGVPFAYNIMIGACKAQKIKAHPFLLRVT